MSRGFPSMTALLGLLAVAGYQNRDKLAELLGGAGQAMSGGAGGGRGMPGGAGGQQGAGAGAQQGGLGGLLGQLGGGVGGAGAGGFLGSGLGELLERFTQAGQGETAQSWVRQGPNEPIDPPRLEQAIGPDVLDALSKQTGLSREELLARLSRELPEAVDKYTPQGQLPL
jgi:uncharacterized protein YidB (DUF937 family)